ncbi:hypothetical protein [Halobellus rarus]|uniref:Uncharacterized protein n=1 Tax=Halobellus rarus TaxID=1126237 RepID=A0ABD6CM44_9EURY|nr:hypothetical protein [Halobellus rarus]
MTDSVRMCDVARIDDAGDERRQHASADVAPELYDAPRRDSTRERAPQTATDGAATEQR